MLCGSPMLESTQPQTTESDTHVPAHIPQLLEALCSSETTMSSEAPTIRRLPESVVTRLRSTLAATTLSDAISELVQNSLDANARSIKIQANLSRNSCVVEDDGVGIAPMDMSMVGKMYATSKYPPAPDSSSATFGFRGQALSSLATHSLLTLTSRHRAHRSTRTVRISYSELIFTGLAPEHLRLPIPGTVVRIEGLWGDMPVRLKARQQEDIEREWEDINRVIVQLLLTPQGRDVAVIARDENGSQQLVVKNGSLGPWEMRVLRQAYGREAMGSGWEKVKAQQGDVKIEGWISTKRSRSRGFQFLYINSHPLPPSTTLLHAEINRILTDSSFGAVEEDGAKATGSKARGGPRKGVDKWGMFILRIDCADSDIDVLGGEGGTEGKAGLEGDYLKRAINLLQKLLREFLKTHHFRPFSISSSPSSNIRGKGSKAGGHSHPSVMELVQRRARSNTPLSVIRNNSDSAIADGREGVLTRETRTLAMWSRVKLAKVDLNEEEGRQRTGFKAKEFSSSFCPTEGAIKNHASFEVTSASSRERESSTDEDGDEYIPWTNPVSKRSFQVNTRTGNATMKTADRNFIQPSPIVGMKRPAPSSLFSGRELCEQPENGPAKRSKTSEGIDTTGKSAFVEQLLKVWENPVFKDTPAPIPSITTSFQLPANHSCIYDYTDGFIEATSTTLGKLTKEGLRKAEVIAQVDRKYILIKMSGISTNNEEPKGDSETQGRGEDRELLVIVDQHAADERVRVESLFAKTYGSSANLPSHTADLLQKRLVYRVNRREWELMKRYEERFREWGINYHLSSSLAPGRNKDEELSLHINSLPKAITDRCTNKPSLVIDMIRTHIYSLSDELPAAHLPTPFPGTNGWVKRIRSCPKGLLDMLNSRACRSAIMFNDPLELAECQVLINKLGECMFPFQCAHGRPSMIPLVDLGVSEGEVEELEREMGGGFMRNFGRWMSKGSEALRE